LNAVLQYIARDMVLHVHSNASFLSKPNTHSRAGGLFFLSTLPSANASADFPLPLNGAIHITSSIMRNVLASATEAEVGALFNNCQDACMLHTTLDKMGHPQPATPVQTDNGCAKGIVNDFVKQKRSKPLLTCASIGFATESDLANLSCIGKRALTNHRQICPTYLLSGT
jgi:hypothetical protein